MDYLTFESRTDDLPALMVLALSMKQFAPKSLLHLPARDMLPVHAAWFEEKENVVLHHSLWPEDSFWNIKPFLLEQMLNKGIDRITWLDADILLTSDPEKFFRVSPETLVVAQEGYRSRNVGTNVRTLAVGHQIGRELGYTVNSCVVSVTGHHAELLSQWKETLRSDVYQSKQDGSILLGDQDVLGGLIGSTEFKDLAVKPIKTGIDIAHDMLASDYGAGQRLATVWRGEPPFVHSQGRKTWRLGPDNRVSRSWLSQLSIYRQSAKQFANCLPPKMTDWLTDDRAVSKFMVAIFPSRPSLRGLPIGICGSVLKSLYRLLKLLRK